jgi:hypothetical protein
MKDDQRFTTRRTRVLLGGTVAIVALAAAGVLGGMGFAKSSVSAAQAQYGKIVICHHTHSKKHPQVTITIAQSAWKAHQKHGDTLGACITTTTTTATTTSSTTTTASHGNSGTHGNSGVHGNSGGNGHGHGH